MFCPLNICFLLNLKKLRLARFRFRVSVWSLNRYTLLELNVNHVGRYSFFLLKYGRYVAISKRLFKLVLMCISNVEPEYPVVRRCIHPHVATADGFFAYLYYFRSCHRVVRWLANLGRNLRFKLFLQVHYRFDARGSSFNIA